MSEEGPEGEKQDIPATPDDYRFVREGLATHEQIQRVLAALRDRNSVLWHWLGDSAPWAQYAVERKYGPRYGVVVPGLTPPAQENYYRVIGYIGRKVERGELSGDEVNGIVGTLHTGHLSDPNPTSSDYAMCVTRMMNALIKLRPQWESEIKALPVSSPRLR